MPRTTFYASSDVRQFWATSSTFSTTLDSSAKFVSDLTEPLLPSRESGGRSSFDPRLTNDPGSSFDSAYKIGTLIGTGHFSDSVSVTDTIDMYRFRLQNDGSFNLTLTGLSADADVALFDRRGQLIAFSNRNGNADETINLQFLEAGAYSIVVNQFSGNTSYDLSLSSDRVSNLLATEVNAGLLDATQTFNGVIQSNNTSDLYSFSLDTTSCFNLSLSGLSSDIDVRLIQDSNGNGVIDPDETIAFSNQGNNRNETINLQALAAGNYFVQVYQFLGEGSYTLNLSTAVPSDLLAAESDLGAFSGTQNVSGTIGALNTADVYEFNLEVESSLSVTLAGLSADVDIRLVRDFNANGMVDNNEEIAFSDNAGTLDEFINLNPLVAGNYLLQVYQYSGETSYNLNLTATPLNADGAGNTLGTAFNIGVLNSSLTFNDFVGTADPLDFYSFSIDTTSTFNLSLTGLSADADAFLIHDANNNGVVDTGEVVAASTLGGTAAESIGQGLSAGTYYIEIAQFSGDTTYTLDVSASAVNLPPGFNVNYGYGLVDAAAAVAAALGLPTFADVPDRGGNDWGLDQVRAPEVWNQGYTGQGVIVAVVDTGVDYNHVDLSGNIWVNAGEIAGDGIDNDNNGFIDDVRGWDFVDADNDPMDTEGHGTHVSGTIAGMNNGFGVTGVAYNSTIMPVRVLGPNGGSSTGVAAGIIYAVNNGADVINLSLGGGFSTEIRDAIEYAFNQGVVVVMAAGNEGQSQPGFPARHATDWGIAVGAVDITNTLANFSNRAGTTPLDYIVAPGVDVLSTTPNNTYSSFSGTSMATPHVAGVAALILSANPGLTPAQVEALLTGTANPNGITV
ncbi:MAG: S8 family serine peptidase [Scytolyngbya sp. HA4215-MV1]|jgi:hypothetical protein|nr:S8 family serine peptidase [Scytolyngbya sp. HA4215-MV1]